MSTRPSECFDDLMKGDPNREVVVFTEALKVAVKARAEFLERVCAGDENLRHKVEALLTAHDRVGDFLDEPAIAATLAKLLCKIGTHASPLLNAPRRGNRKTERAFQLRLRKRKGKNEK